MAKLSTYLLPALYNVESRPSALKVRKVHEKCVQLKLVLKYYRCFAWNFSHTNLQKVDRFFPQEHSLTLPKRLQTPTRGGGHKSHPLRDYTLLKAYDPDWMESRAMEGATGKTPACLEWLWLTHWPHSPLSRFITIGMLVLLISDGQNPV